MKNAKQSSMPSDDNSNLSRRDFLMASAVTAGGVFLPSMMQAAAESSPGAQLTSARAEPWAPHPRAAPKTEQRSLAFAIDANGTRTCTGGWQWRYEGIVPERGYEISTDVVYNGVAVPRDALNCIAIWGSPKPTQNSSGAIWEYLLPSTSGPERLRFSRQLVAPPGATHLTVRATLRWTAAGKTVWQIPRVVATAPAPKLEPVRISVVTGGNAERRRRQFKTAQDNISFFGEHCEAACRQDHPALIVLPEVALQWGVRGHALDVAVPAPGPETEAFSSIARRHRTRIALGMYERDGDAVYNSLILIGTSGAIEGRYRKVHLAQGEDLSGVLPGDTFPVFSTDVGRIGCNICMDSMAPESARLAALNGADFLLLPIMGDFRADRWDMGPPVFNEDRWRAIMRTQALDNQFSLVVARNRAEGSCIINRKGDFLAWNNGEQAFITADVPREDDFRSWNGSCFRDSAWQVRRPHLYNAFTDTAAQGGSI